ncbi:pao retrotransposon peptidase domain-containing protein [Phthorimaea operculella]|nr:pao retrotransposon peptidase domain-containing protein [Phthorimaea operculella]
MYRQILIRPEDRPWQHILWRESPADGVQDFELRTVTYGVTSSPYLAIRTLHQLAADHGAQWPRAADALRHHTYMDDITYGSDSVESALEIKNELINMLNCAKLELRKWTSNSTDFLEKLPVEHCQAPKVFAEDDSRSVLKILGIQWDPQADAFTYSVSHVDIEFTKRSILSNVARIFDPLGWVTPYVLTAKLILQNLWRLQLNWDEEIPRDISNDWRKFVQDLNNLPNIRIPRHAVTSNAVDAQLIGFCDGSTKAYGCCVYLRSTSPDGDIQVKLLIAKSKVAPLKPLTVNRLELCGAALLAQVLKHMANTLSSKLNLTQVIAFSDSSTVLSWLKTAPHKLKTFVAHRVVKISDAIHQSQWRHVSTHDNPADYCSRGLTCEELVHCDAWWSGPQWLRKEQSNWPAQRDVETCSPIPELKSTSLLVQSMEPGNVEVFQTLMERFSSLSRLQRVLAWCLRFINNTKRSIKRESLINGPLTCVELTTALRTIIRHVQSTAFDSSAIRDYKGLPKSLKNFLHMLILKVCFE